MIKILTESDKVSEDIYILKQKCEKKVYWENNLEKANRARDEG